MSGELSIDEETIDQLRSFAVPNLAVEFTDTLSAFWVTEREKLAPQMTGDLHMLAKLLDSLASVVNGADVVVPTG